MVGIPPAYTQKCLKDIHGQNKPHQVGNPLHKGLQWQHPGGQQIWTGRPPGIAQNSRIATNANATSKKWSIAPDCSDPHPCLKDKQITVMPLSMHGK
mmetsp:Transcript_46372/g.86626  ORF Transcript_46372/g.86626 Transcript_46372/m.86626 type:complete len:97 (+) Transcript_46372:55-345(+)